MSDPWDDYEAVETVKQEEEIGSSGQVYLAEGFAAANAERVRYVHSIGWHVWDGTRWSASEDRVDLALVMDHLKQVAFDAAALGSAGKAVAKLATSNMSARGCSGVLTLVGAISPISTTHHQLDADPSLFNTPGGTIDLITGEIREHRHADLITKSSGAGRDEHGDGLAMWSAFLERILPDPEVRAFVQRLIGYSMSGDVQQHVMPIFTGSGANGKGTFRDAVMSAFGDYAEEVDPQLLMEQKQERHGTYKMVLRGLRLAFCSETERGKTFSVSTMKRLTGGDPIQANHMRQDAITFDPSHTLIMLTNHLPEVTDDDAAVWRRIVVVPFDVVIPKEEQDGELPSRLKLASAEIISWALQGWVEFKRQGLNPPYAVIRRTGEYKAGSDVLGRFLEERTEAVEGYDVSARTLYIEWSKWCHEVNEAEGSEKTFGLAMKSKKFEKRRVATGLRYQGMRMRADSEAPPIPLWQTGG